MAHRQLIDKLHAGDVSPQGAGRPPGWTSGALSDIRSGLAEWL